jgi:hypothetical protein
MELRSLTLCCADRLECHGTEVMRMTARHSILGIAVLAVAVWAIADEGAQKEPRLDSDWQTMRPLDLLARLRAHPTANVYTLLGRRERWVSEEDLPELIGLVDSRDPCPHVVSVYSSYLPRERSFVGQEALFLVEGYRQGYYPPALHSRGFYSTNRESILAWWRERATKR